jgi:hypothetical protein
MRGVRDKPLNRPTVLLANDDAAGDELVAAVEAALGGQLFVSRALGGGVEPSEVPMKRLMLLGAAACGLILLSVPPAQAQLNGSHTLGDFGVNSGTQPGPGFYAALFYLHYGTDTIKDADGDTVRLATNSPSSLGVSAIAPMACT